MLEECRTAIARLLRLIFKSSSSICNILSIPQSPIYEFSALAVVAAACASGQSQTPATSCEQVGRQQFLPTVPEASGIAHAGGVLWTHNDSDAPVLFRLDAAGTATPVTCRRRRGTRLGRSCERAVPRLRRGYGEAGLPLHRRHRRQPVVTRAHHDLRGASAGARQRRRRNRLTAYSRQISRSSARRRSAAGHEDKRHLHHHERSFACAGVSRLRLRRTLVRRVRLRSFGR